MIVVGSGRGSLARVQHRPDEALDAREPREARLLRVGAAPEVAARLEEEAGERARLEPVGVQEREPAEARAEPDAAAPAEARELVERASERAGKCRRGRVRLQAVVRHDERDAVRRHCRASRRGD